MTERLSLTPGAWDMAWQLPEQRTITVEVTYLARLPERLTVEVGEDIRVHPGMVEIRMVSP